MFEVEAARDSRAYIGPGYSIQPTGTRSRYIHEFDFSETTTSDIRGDRRFHQPRELGVDPVAGFQRLVLELAALRTSDDDSEPPNALAEILGLRVLTLGIEHELLPTRVRRSPDGGVLLAFLRGSRYAKIEAFNNGEVFAALSGPEPFTPQAWPIATDLSDMPAILELFKTHLT